MIDLEDGHAPLGPPENPVPAVDGRFYDRLSASEIQEPSEIVSAPSDDFVAPSSLTYEESYTIQDETKVVEEKYEVNGNDSDLNRKQLFPLLH